MTLREYAAWWEQHKAGLDDRLLYLKDWHFVYEFPEYQARTTQHINTCLQTCTSTSSSHQRTYTVSLQSQPVKTRSCLVPPFPGLQTQLTMM